MPGLFAAVQERGFVSRTSAEGIEDGVARDKWKGIKVDLSGQIMRAYS